MDTESISAGGNILRKDVYSYTTGSVSGNGVYYWIYTYDSAWKNQLKTVAKYKNIWIPNSLRLYCEFLYMSNSPIIKSITLVEDY